MKRLGSSDSLGALMSICPSSADEHNNHHQGNNNNNNTHVYPREFQSMMLEGLDEEGCVEESSGHIMLPEKKRRLSVDQVKALEKNFEVENKLEPERKVKLAQELGLQPRQVAVWFQNRRARWKTKQLERDYGLLKANYDALKHNYETLQHDNEALVKEIRELKAKLQEDDKGESKVSSIKEEKADKEVVVMMDHQENQNRVKVVTVGIVPECDVDGDGDGVDDDDDAAAELNFESFNGSSDGGGGTIGLMGASFFTDFKDGSSDSDSSAIFNEDNNHHNNNNGSPNAAISSCGAAGNNNMLQSAHNSHQFFGGGGGGGFHFSSDSSRGSSILEDAVHKAAVAYQPQFVKIEEHNFFSDESCSTFFSDDQPPTLQWDCPDDWN